MATSKGNKAVVIINGSDLSTFLDTSEHHRKPDIIDKTTYGKDAHVKEGTLLDGNGSLGGIYDTSTSAGPRAILEPLCGQTVTMIRRVEGTGAGKPQMTVSVVIGEYVETVPVGDIVRWTQALEYSDTIVDSIQ